MPLQYEENRYNLSTTSRKSYGSTNEMFYLLEKNGYFDYQLSENMVKAVGFRNLVVHEYGKIDLKLVYNVTATHLDDLVDYLKAVFQKAGIAGDP